MSTYCYTLRAQTKNVFVDGKWQALPQFKFAYGNAGSWYSRYDAQTQRIRAAQFAAAEKAFDRFRRDGLVLALDGEWVVLTRRDEYLDGPAIQDIHAVIIGKVQKVSGRLHCIDQYTTEELGRAASLQLHR